MNEMVRCHLNHFLSLIEAEETNKQKAKKEEEVRLALSPVTYLRFQVTKRMFFNCCFDLELHFMGRLGRCVQSKWYFSILRCVNNKIRSIHEIEYRQQGSDSKPRGGLCVFQFLVIKSFQNRRR